MKFLIALSVLASSSVFAQYNHGGDKIKCYESAQQSGYGKAAFVFEVESRQPSLESRIELVYPDHINLRQDEGCLKTDWRPGALNNPDGKFEACPGEGQEIGRLTPVEIEYQEEEDTYYCDKRILRYFGNYDVK